MSYCCQCGNPTRENDLFCAACGERQPSASAASGGVSPRTASILCYIPVVGWIAAIIVLASHRFRRDAAVRFHAFQGIYLFVAWLIVDWATGPGRGLWEWGPRAVFNPWFMIGGLLRLAVLVTWIFMLVKTSQGETYKLPILGELADRSVAEQK